MNNRIHVPLSFLASRTLRGGHALVGGATRSIVASVNRPTRASGVGNYWAGVVRGAPVPGIHGYPFADVDAGLCLPSSSRREHVYREVVQVIRPVLVRELKQIAGAASEETIPGRSTSSATGSEVIAGSSTASAASGLTSASDVTGTVSGVGSGGNSSTSSTIAESVVPQNASSAATKPAIAEDKAIVLLRP